MKGRKWTQEEIDFLEEKWGIVAIPTIADRLNRSIHSVKNKAYKIGLKRHIHSSDAITLNQIFVALGVKSAAAWYSEKFIANGLPYIRRKSISKTFRLVHISEFWKWLEKNKTIVNLKNFEENSLGEEPLWVKEKRRADILATKYKKTSWSLEEDNMLKSLLNHYRFGYKDISEKLQRTENAIKRRMVELGLKVRPLKADNHTKWTKGEVDLLIRMYSKGYQAELIAEKLDIRSACAVRGKIERLQKEGVVE